VSNGLGYIEFELCKLLRVTPKELGEKRRRDPDGLRFLELSMMDRWNKEYEAHKKAESKSKSGKGIKRIRRK